MWSLHVRAYTHLKRSGKKQLVRAIQMLGRPGVAKSPYEMAAGEERIRMIGGALHVAGERWARTHQAQLEWLADQNVTTAQAVEAYRAWRAEIDADPFWRRGAADGS